MDEENFDTEPLLPKPKGHFDSSGEYELSPEEMRKRNHYLDMSMGIMVPWVCFTFLLVLFSYYDDVKFLVWFYVGSCALAALVMLLLGHIAKHGLILLVAILTLTSLLIGVSLGLFMQDYYLDYYNDVTNGQTYEDVDPHSEAKAKGNAGVVNFVKGAFVDDFRTIGYVDGGTIYCIAPVAKETQYSTGVEYWATGKNCCLKRSKFHCGDSLDAKKPLKTIVAKRSDFWQKAVAEAASVYNTNSSSHALFLDFVAEPSDAEDDIWGDAVLLALVACLLHLATVSAIVYTVYKAMPEKMSPKDAEDFMSYYASRLGPNLHKMGNDQYKDMERHTRLAHARARTATMSSGTETT